MNTLSFMTANYVARQIGYNTTKGWMEGDDATNAYFAPLDTYADRFGALLAEIKSLGFEAIDLWLAHLNWRWATEEHIAIAKQSLSDANLSVSSLAGWFGGTPAEFAAACRLGQAMGVSILGGNTGLLNGEQTTLAAIAREHGVRLGYENHPERNTAEMYAKIGAGNEDVIGFCVDTGWFGTHSYDAVAALHEVAPRLFHVHLKDVLAAGAHDTCRYGRGCVPIEACVHTLVELGYTGGISIEHEPDQYSPNEEVVANLAMVKSWLAQ